MAEKKKKEAAGAPAWMVTFADMMTLLLCFFVLLLSFSVMDQMKFVEVAGSLEKAFGIQRSQPLIGMPKGQEIISKDFKGQPIDLSLKVQIMDTLAEELQKGLVEAEEDETGVTVRVKEQVAFDSGRAEIKPAFRAILDKLGKTVADLDALVEVSGHTDNVPLKKDAPFHSNWGLSAARAVNVVEYWIEKFDIPANRLKAVAYADGHPVAPNSTAEGRARNRRVEFKIKPGLAGPIFDEIRPPRSE